ncbi:hypothetical protein DCE93_04260 [Agromyces badenianii]|uniref:Uncharacterized protein n=1 Tax=Agromyces badenianii TaxID=2080742 RepID=A0A2S0WUK1_9MICO|nr:hypothetical protein [Agromyces badenianii]AWB94970.1 hypothetical protein DCE93_04260 [Agromyces badenianii]PWC03038.1 hypothetical protein DCE94_12170 [Agromyces badenianii]
MELIFIVVGGAILGLAAHFVLPLRHLRGVAVGPAIGAGVAALVWVGLTWLGWPWDGGWIWVVSLVASALVPAAVLILVSPRRERADAALFERLSRPGAARA